MKKIVWRDPNHMVFESGHKAFDAQTNCIFTGNVVANTQLSYFVRARTEIHCNGRVWPEGHLRDFDLSGWRGEMPRHVRRIVGQEAEDRSIILYQFSHRSRGRRIVHGWVVTTTNHELIRKIVTGPTYKSYRVIDEAAQYVSDTLTPAPVRAS